MAKTPNSLIKESSPYLLQHAYNPVAWLPFGDEAFERAKKENKPVLISIGYSACHWCHVMEHECFEDEEVAALMNENFINIKVDREERSDVDMIYMQAVQLMTGHGGWPLNCFALPDGRPIYGGTYFPKQQWMNVLSNISGLYKKDIGKVEEYAANLLDGIRQSEIIMTQKQHDVSLSREVLKSTVNKWKERFDNELGGPDKAPKFPLPNNYLFLMRYALLEKDKEVLDHVHLTLEKMANGGIYDQLHGGFARYSVDEYWKVPHFEKMLYDNAQLVSLYCEAYQHSQNDLYKKIVTETLDFVKREWLSEDGGFFSAYDADSEGEEGKFYVWSREELRMMLGNHFDLFADYFKVSGDHGKGEGYWEHGNYILMRNHKVAELAVKHGISVDELNRKIERCREILHKVSEGRIKPGLDDKIITSWNAMMCSAYARAYLVFGKDEYLHTALRSCEFIMKKLKHNARLFHTYKNHVGKINAFLDDYAFVTEAYLLVYTITQNEEYLQKAKEMTEWCLEEFHNDNSPLLYYTDREASGLITRSSEVSDNVIPASNSQMALNLFYIGTLFSDNKFIDRAAKMLNSVLEDMKHYGSGYSNWACLGLHLAYPFKEIAIVGKNVNEKLLELHQHSFTNAILAVSDTESILPLVANRLVAGETMVYVCENSTCKLPVKSVSEAIKIL